MKTNVARKFTLLVFIFFMVSYCVSVGGGPPSSAELTREWNANLLFNSHFSIKLITLPQSILDIFDVMISSYLQH